MATEEKPRPKTAGEARHYLQDKVFVWPFLVRAEFIAAIVVTLILSVWSIVIDAPLEEHANPTKTPNPSKAPWYFLGLQEMLVYFDPWYAGVVLPSFIVLGLMAIPYVDINPKGNGYYTWKERKFAIGTFIFGFHILWVLLIIVGVFLRGPGWNFFAPWQYWDPHKVVALTNVDFSYWLFAVDPKGIGGVIIGSAAIAMFFAPIPLIWMYGQKKGWKLLEQLGLARYITVASLWFLMMGLPAKMLLRWTFNIKYILVTPWFNI